MEKQYILEYMGVFLILTAKLITEGDPFILGTVVFAVFIMTRNITTGYFSPFIPLINYSLGRTTVTDVTYNLIAQCLGALSAGLLFTPITTFIKEDSLK
jgi:glycerol uptake facilitator-like aquaporin